MSTDVTQSLRCSDWARSEAVDPIGSAGSYRGFLLMDIPLPWPRDIGETEEVREVADLLTGRGLRVQGLVPDGRSNGTVILYEAEPGSEGFMGFTKRETRLHDGRGDGDLRSALSELLEGLKGPGDNGPGVGAQDLAQARDVLVCTHGRRDVCCGSLGLDLEAQLRDQGLTSEVRLWRTSHTGGHRFAPTFIVLPEATAWAFADVDLVKRVIDRTGEAREVAGRYRGCSGLHGPRVQALEREVLCNVGWDLLDRPRSGRQDGEAAVLEVSRPAGGVDVWTATVRAGRVLPVPDCRRPIEEAHKTETEWVVEDLALT